MILETAVAYNEENVRADGGTSCVVRCGITQSQGDLRFLAEAEFGVFTRAAGAASAAGDLAEFDQCILGASRSVRDLLAPQAVALA